MAKPDRIKTYIRSSDGNVYADMGTGLSSLSVKGASSEKIATFVLEEPASVLTVENFAYKDMFNFTFDLRCEPGTTDHFDYVIRFNGDVSNSYSSNGLGQGVNRGLLVRAGPGSSSVGYCYGSIGLNAQVGIPRITYGAASSGRGHPVSLKLGTPIIGWNNSDDLVESISFTGVTMAGVVIPGFKFLGNSKVMILGRDF
jgi:hypothetical protein